jgi:hypothetical protein
VILFVKKTPTATSEGGNCGILSTSRNVSAGKNDGGWQGAVTLCACINGTIDKANRGRTILMVTANVTSMLNCGATCTSSMPSEYLLVSPCQETLREVEATLSMSRALRFSEVYDTSFTLFGTKREERGQFA